MELETKIGFICVIGFTIFYFSIKAMYEQPFVCEKQKDVCYTTTFWIKTGDEVKNKRA